jgi:hypothetical protein
VVVGWCDLTGVKAGSRWSFQTGQSCNRLTAEA